ncbi:hypothetical protein LP414_11815 [Polaromonas sp. P1(28)-13]|nr:hypothetical protein LP414_11815 [Polaromonas sp. P1(28)-13]
MPRPPPTTCWAASRRFWSAACIDALSPGSIQLLARQSEEFGMKALLALNKSALVAEQKDTDDTTPRQRMTFGIYFYAEPTELDAGAPSDAAGKPPKGEPA